MRKRLLVLNGFVVLIVILLPLYFIVTAKDVKAAPTVKKIGLFPEDCISADELLQKQQKKSERLLILDARSQISYDQGHIQGAVLPRTDDYYENERLFRQGAIKVRPDADAALAEGLKKYPKDVPVVTYCGDGCKASVVMLLQIRRLGFSHVKVMDDGYEVWEKKGYPVKKEKEK